MTDFNAPRHDTENSVDDLEPVSNALANLIEAGTRYNRVIIQSPRDGDFGGKVPWFSESYDDNGSVLSRIVFLNARAARQWLEMAKAHGHYVEQPAQHSLAHIPANRDETPKGR